MLILVLVIVVFSALSVRIALDPLCLKLTAQECQIARWYHLTSWKQLCVFHEHPR